MFFGHQLDWKQDGRDWPNREASRFVNAAGLRWHVQKMGQGPVLLLVHGTGASTHSWRDLAPLLAARFTVIAPDLPGHGFTTMPATHRLSLPGMADALTQLLRALDTKPALAAGHSAGAAILIRQCLDGGIAPRGLVSLNGALLPLSGVAGHLFSPLARLLTKVPVVPWLFAWRATDRAVIDRLLQGTGSTIDSEGAALYARLASNPGHVAAALGMMANWDLRALEREMPGLKTKLLLIAGTHDRTIPAAQSQRVGDLVPGAQFVALPALGHLAHEEEPKRIAELITELGRCVDVLQRC
jgi:magnesium chelatase accessory protein